MVLCRVGIRFWEMGAVGCVWMRRVRGRNHFPCPDFWEKLRHTYFGEAEIHCIPANGLQRKEVPDRDLDTRHVMSKLS